MGFFDKAKDLYKFRQEANKVKKELQGIHIEASEKGVIVTINGEQHVVDVKIDKDHYGDNFTSMQNDLKEAFNKGIKKAQLIASEKMKSVMSSMPPGLM